MNHKDYSKPYKIFYDAFIDIILLDRISYEYLDIISMWKYDFNSIVETIPLNDEGIFIGLAYHYHVDCPWEKYSPDPWEVDDIELFLSQMKYAKNIIVKKNKNSETDDNYEILYKICEDICYIFQKAKDNNGIVYIKYYY